MDARRGGTPQAYSDDPPPGQGSASSVRHSRRPGKDAMPPRDGEAFHDLDARAAGAGPPLRRHPAERPVPHAPEAWDTGRSSGHLRPKARVTVWVTPPPLRCSAVTRMDTYRARDGALSDARQVPFFSFSP